MIPCHSQSRARWLPEVAARVDRHADAEQRAHQHAPELRIAFQYTSQISSTMADNAAHRNHVLDSSGRRQHRIKKRTLNAYFSRLRYHRLLQQRLTA
jgi:hypothetical protein